jgi:alpha-ketoglutarate-dependent 2,4-dichlorophenoxyacetate dioxygenase
LLAYEIPEKGGATQVLPIYLPPLNDQFSDVRTAYADLPESKKEEIEDMVVLHSLWHSRKLASPGYVASEHEKKIRPGAKHRLVQTDLEGRKVIPT